MSFWDNWESYVSSPYGYRTHPISNEYKLHSGTDLALSANTPIPSNINGTVTVSAYNNSYGNYVVVRDNKGLLHYYAHMNERNVNVGDTISVGDTLGLVGSTGNSTGNHLHYEIRGTDGKSIDSGKYLDNVSVVTTEDVTLSNLSLKEKIAYYAIEVFKYIIIVLIIILSVYLFTKSIDM